MSQLENELNSEAKSFYNGANTSFSNCHRTGIKPKNTEDNKGSDSDSSKSKEVVTEDNRQRKDGPGGN